MALHGGVVVFLTLLTQLGGIAWLLSRLSRWPLAAFLVLYTTLSVAAVFTAPLAGRVALPCAGDGPMQIHSPLLCVLNRHYVTPELRDVLRDYGAHMDAAFPGTEARVLDASFPFLDGFPLLPHLSHDDGEKVDLAFYYQDEAGAFTGNRLRSPIGYFAFQDGPTTCPQNRITLRWDLAWLQPLWPDFALDPARMTAATQWLANDPRIGRVLLEPHLKARFAPNAGKVRFQGCRAARHDDHFHIQL